MLAKDQENGAGSIDIRGVICLFIGHRLRRKGNDHACVMCKDFLQKFIFCKKSAYMNFMVCEML